MSAADDALARAHRRYLDEGGPPECWNRVLLTLILRGYTGALEERHRVQKDLISKLAAQNENVERWWRLFNEAFDGLKLDDGNMKTKPGIGPEEEERR